jgi:hypothetical protein
VRHIEEQKGQRESEDHAGGPVVVSNCSPSFSNLGQKKKEEGKRCETLDIIKKRRTMEKTKWVFVIVVAGEVHPQPQLLVFGKIRRAIFLSWDPLITVVCHRFLRSSILLLLV